MDNVLEMRERFEEYDLELTGIGLGGDCIKNQLLGLPERDREIENVCRTIRSIGEAYADGASAPVVIIDQRTTYWAPKGPHWHPGYERLAVGRGGVYLTTFDADRIQGELNEQHLLRTLLNNSPLAVIVGNRDFFPDELVTEARQDVLAVFDEMGIESVMLAEEDTNLGGVETWEDAKKCAAWT